MVELADLVVSENLPCVDTARTTLSDHLGWSSSFIAYSYISTHHPPTSTSHTKRRKYPTTSPITSSPATTLFPSNAAPHPPHPSPKHQNTTPPHHYTPINRFSPLNAGPKQATPYLCPDAATAPQGSCHHCHTEALSCQFAPRPF